MSVDIELGYADTIDEIVENITKIIEAGAIEECNISNLIETVKQIQDENKISKLLDHDFSYEIANKIFAR